MTTYYKATTAAGEIALRSTKSRTYTHAVVRFGKSGRINQETWAGRPDLAEKAARPGKWADGQGTLLPAVEITAKEYRALRKIETEEIEARKAAKETARVAEAEDDPGAPPELGGLLSW